MSNTMHDQYVSSYLDGDNAAYLEELYDAYRLDPNSVDASWQAVFKEWPANLANGEVIADVRQRFIDLAKAPLSAVQSVTSGTDLDKQLKLLDLIQAYRRFGHLKANIDPLGLMVTPEVPELNPSHYGLSLNDPTRYSLNGFGGLSDGTVADCVTLATNLLCKSIGFEYEHLDSPIELDWLRSRIENSALRSVTFDQQQQLLQSLTEAEGLEKYLGSRFVGEKRFSLEGGETFIPVLQNLIKKAAAANAKEVLVAMAHRGRLNVLVNVFGKPPKELFSQFDGSYQYTSGRSDDVKYHYGYSTDVEAANGPLHLVLGFNPSHLEIINPVVEGSARARQDRRKDTKGDVVIPIVVHGDSAIAGQGVVFETMAFSQIPGFKTGGTVHIVINNQVGFTTSNPHDTRSTLYCTDIIKAINAPVFHVNADDPEAALFVTQLAFDFRQRFNRDVMIDLVCYRRLGHNEGDEPSATQPIMYKTIRQLASTRKLYAERLNSTNIISLEQSDAMVNHYRDRMDLGEAIVTKIPNSEQLTVTPDWSLYDHQTWDQACPTAINEKLLSTLVEQLAVLPSDFKLQAQVERAMKLRVQAFQGEIPMVWGDAETLAYASLVHNGHSVRLCGQDSGRGTFSHRHAELHDQNTGAIYRPLQHISNATFTVIDSLLSEVAVLAFEYGYSTTDPVSLVLWEAQFGDFANGAQVVIDQFLASGEQKWGRLSGLTLLLPHGYEGMGPEHSSARLERYLQLCAQDNIQVCTPTTPAQMFHLLRRQALRPYRKPLIVMTPKSLLRKATSTLNELTSGAFQVVIPEALTIKAPKRVILCSGKVYYDLLDARKAADKDQQIALVRIEQLYPLATDAITALLKTYKNMNEIVWCQEEPQNQGAWAFIKLHLEPLLNKGQQLRYMGRAESASTAAGYRKLHDAEFKGFLSTAMDIG